MWGTSDFNFNLRAQQRVLEHSMIKVLPIYAYLFELFSEITDKKRSQATSCLRVFHVMRKNK